jgi:uncharacterized protein YqgQ
MSCCRLYFGRRSIIIEFMENGVKRLVRYAVRELLELLLEWLRARRDVHNGT